MKLIIKRITSIIYQSDSLLELELDPLSLSGIDYWSQEARSAKIKLLMDDTLESILVGSLPVCSLLLRSSQVAAL
jgi:hypothetical protein